MAGEARVHRSISKKERFSAHIEGFTTIEVLKPPFPALHLRRNYTRAELFPHFGSTLTSYPH